jgi:hypothetical protein
MPFCINCGKENAASAKFCTSCGTTVLHSTGNSDPVKPEATDSPKNGAQQKGPTRKNVLAIGAVLGLIILAGLYFFVFRNQGEENTGKNEVQSGAEVPGEFPQTSVRVLSQDEFEGLTAETLQLMRNEIYARHGLIFTNNSVHGYFSAKSWYRPQYDDVTGMLSVTEQKNIALIKARERILKQLNSAATEEMVNSYVENDKLVFKNPCYVIVNGSYGMENDARTEVSRLRNAGYSNPGYLWIPDFPSLSGKPFYATFLGPYPTREACRDAFASIPQTGRYWYGIRVSYDPEREEIR